MHQFADSGTFAEIAEQSLSTQVLISLHRRFQADCSNF